MLVNRAREASSRPRVCCVGRLLCEYRLPLLSNFFIPQSPINSAKYRMNRRVTVLICQAGSEVEQPRNRMTLILRVSRSHCCRLERDAFRSPEQADKPKDDILQSGHVVSMSAQECCFRGLRYHDQAGVSVWKLLRQHSC